MHCRWWFLCYSWVSLSITSYGLACWSYSWTLWRVFLLQGISYLWFTSYCQYEFSIQSKYSFFLTLISSSNSQQGIHHTSTEDSSSVDEAWVWTWQHGRIGWERKEFLVQSVDVDTCKECDFDGRSGKKGECGFGSRTNAHNTERSRSICVYSGRVRLEIGSEM